MCACGSLVNKRYRRLFPNFFNGCYLNTFGELMLTAGATPILQFVGMSRRFRPAERLLGRANGHGFCRAWKLSFIKSEFSPEPKKTLSLGSPKILIWSENYQ